MFHSVNIRRTDTMINLMKYLSGNIRQEISYHVAAARRALEDRRFSFYMLFSVLLAFFVAAHVPLSQPVNDPFQEGEYSALGIFDSHSPNFPRQLLIHGGMDIVPAKIAALIFDQKTQIVFIRLINQSIQFISTILYLLVAIIAVKFNHRKSYLTLISAFCTVLLLNGRTVSVLDAQQGAPSVRDFFVLIGVAQIFYICYREYIRPAKSMILPLIILGFACGLGMFWCYNRGLALFVCAGLFTSGYCALRRSVRPAASVAGGFIGAAILVSFLSGRFHIIPETLGNIHYWSENQVVWKAPIYIRDWLPFFALISTSGCVIVFNSKFLLKIEFRMLFLLLLSICSLVSMYVLESINRPDVWNIRWCVWPATLIFLISIAISQRAGDISDGPGPLSSALSVSLLVAISCICISPYSFPGTLQTIFGGLSDNMRLLSKPVPSDLALVGADRARVAALIAANGGCTFAANDDAIIYLVSRTPPCSRFSLGDYIAPIAQASVIEELKASSPPCDCI